MRIATLITGLGITAVALSGCGGTTTTSEKFVEKTTVTETVSASATAPSPAPSTAASASAADLPQPPAGVTPREARANNGSGSFVAINADGQTAGPTYFSVCAGADEEAVRQCSENNANNNNGNDNNQNNNGN